MNNFTLHNPTEIVFGKNTIIQLRDLISKNERVMLLYGEGSIKKNGVYNQVMDALSGHVVIEFSGIQPNPEYETCMQAVKVAAKENVTFLLSVGGGSVLDAVKFIAAAMRFRSGDPWDILVKGAPVASAMPIGCVLTLPATGSEMNANSVISRKSTNQKLAFSNPHVIPKFSILDPETTYTLSPRQTGNGVVDAFVHVMEQYLTYPVHSPLQDRQAEAILFTLIESGPKVMNSPYDYDARADVMWCATNALNMLIGCGTAHDWSTHLIGHELTVLHGLDHARTLAIILPAIMKHQRKQKREKVVQYGRRIWELTGDEEPVIDQAIEKTEAFFKLMGLPTRLNKYDITVNSCLIAAERIAGRVGQIGERKDIGKAEIEAILRLAG